MVVAEKIVAVLNNVPGPVAASFRNDTLLAGVQQNGCETITVHDCALAATSGEAVLYPHGSSLMWTLIPERGSRGGLTVRCCTLDECGLSVPPPDLIKIDTEGAEVDVLR